MSITFSQIITLRCDGDTQQQSLTPPVVPLSGFQSLRPLTWGDATVVKGALYTHYHVCLKQKARHRSLTSMHTYKEFNSHFTKRHSQISVR